jgi:hypothetical protein
MQAPLDMKVNSRYTLYIGIPATANLKLLGQPFLISNRSAPSTLPSRKPTDSVHRAKFWDGHFCQLAPIPKPLLDAVVQESGVRLSVVGMAWLLSAHAAAAEVLPLSLLLTVLDTAATDFRYDYHNSCLVPLLLVLMSLSHHTANVFQSVRLIPLVQRFTKSLVCNLNYCVRYPLNWYRRYELDDSC